MTVRSVLLRAVLAVGCVCSLAAAARAQSVEQDRTRMERQTIDWFNAMNSEGPYSRLASGVAESVRGALDGGRHASLLVPAEFSRNGKAYYATTYGGILHVFDLTTAQARELELGGDGVVVQEGSIRRDVRGRAVAQVERLSIDNIDQLTSSQPITGTVVCRTFGELPKGLALRVAYKRTGSTRTMTKPIDYIPADGVLSFRISPIDGADDDQPHKGPLPLFVDVIVEGGEDDFFGDELPDTVVSNSLGVLIDVKKGGVAGTTWQFGGGSSKVTFFSNGEVDFSDTEAGGKWRQDGNKLSFDCNNFTLFEVTIEGDQMTGTWRRLQGEDVGITAPTSLTRVASLR